MPWSTLRSPRARDFGGTGRAYVMLAVPAGTDVTGSRRRVWWYRSLRPNGSRGRRLDDVTLTTTHEKLDLGVRGRWKTMAPHVPCLHARPPADMQ